MRESIVNKALADFDAAVAQMRELLKVNAPNKARHNRPFGVWISALRAPVCMGGVGVGKNKVSPDLKTD